MGGLRDTMRHRWRKLGDVGEEGHVTTEGLVGVAGVVDKVNSADFHFIDECPGFEFCLYFSASFECKSEALWDIT